MTFPLNLALQPPRESSGNRRAWVIKGIPYLALVVLVLARIGRGRFTFAQFYFPLSCLVALLVATTPQIDPRFRVPMIPLLALLALLPKNAESSPPV